MNLPRGVGLPRRFRHLDWMVGAIEALNAFGLRGDHTLLHGDHHLGNLYLHADGTAVCSTGKARHAEAGRTT